MESQTGSVVSESQSSTLESELARCDAEIEEIRTRPDVVAGEAPAWLVHLGISDWETEKSFILRKSTP